MNKSVVCSKCGLSDKVTTAEMVECLYESNSESTTNSMGATVSNSGITMSKSRALTNGVTKAKILEKIPKKPKLPQALEVNVIFSFIISSLVGYFLVKWMNIEITLFVGYLIVMFGVFGAIMLVPVAKKLFDEECKKYFSEKDFYDRFWICLRDGETWLEEVN